MASLRRVLLLQRDVPSAAKFYVEALGLSLRVCTEQWAELQCQGGTTIALKATQDEEQLSRGYSPMLWLTVDDVTATVVNALQMGATLDGAIQHEPHTKVAALRAPDGHLIALVEDSGGP